MTDNINAVNAKVKPSKEIRIIDNSSQTSPHKIDEPPQSHANYRSNPQINLWENVGKRPFIPRFNNQKHALNNKIPCYNRFDGMFIEGDVDYETNI